MTELSILLRRLCEIARATYHEFNDDDVLTYSAALAYHAVLALFPFLLFLLALVTFLDVPIVFDRLMQWSRTVLPPEGIEIVADVVADYSQSDSKGLLSLGVLGAIWAASGGVRSAITSLNIAYDVVERRPTWRRYLISVVFTIGIGALLLLAMALLLLGPRAITWVSSQLQLGDWLIKVWSWARFPIAFAILTVVSAFVYSVLPNVRGFRLFSVGSLFAVASWIALSQAFRFYLAHFGNYDVVYGSVGAVIVLLLYLWLSSIVLLAGGEINAVLTARRINST